MTTSAAVTRTRPARAPRAARPQGHCIDPRLVVALSLVLPLLAALSGVVSIKVPDDTIAEVEERPSEADPGPIIHSGADGLTFSTSGTNQAVAWYAELTRVTNNASRSSAVIQGTSHTFLDWFYAKQNGGSKYTILNATGVYDSNAGGYLVPLLFIKSSQGQLHLTSYDGTTPSAPTTTTYYWAFDATMNQYVFGSTKNMATSAKIDPITNSLGTRYQFTLETNQFVVTANGGSSQYLPTITQGGHVPYSLLGSPGTKTWYLMMDPPAGVHEDTYDYTLRVTGTGV